MKKMFIRQAYYYASAVFVIVSLVYFAATINQSYIGLDLTNVNGQWIVAFSDPFGEGYKLGIRVGDSILKINNDDSGKYRCVQKWSEAEGASSIQFQRSGKSTVNNINIPKRTFLLDLLSEIPMFILGFVFWISGLITWSKRHFLVQARALFWLSWFIGFAIVLAPASSRDLMFARELEIITFSSVPILLVNFVSVFPSENKNRVNRYALFMLAVMFVIISSLAILQSIGIVQYSSIKKLVLANMILGISLALWNLGALIKLPKDRPEKNQASIILLGLAIGFLPFALLTAVPIIFDFQPIVNSQSSYLFISAIPFTWYYVIVHKYLPDSRRLFGIIISFFFAGVIMSLVVSYVLFRLKVVVHLNLVVYLATLSLTMSFMVCYSFIRAEISKLLEKFLLFEGNRDLGNRVLKLNESLTSINEEDRILEEVVKSLTIEGAYIIVKDNKGGYLKRAVGIFLEKPSELIKLEGFFQANQRNYLEAKILPDDLPAEIYISYSANNFSCGIFLGHRYSHVKFRLDELPLIMLISSQLAQRLITTFVIKELSKEIKDLARGSLDSQLRNQGLQGITTSLLRSIEKERKIIAREIHDGPLQLELDLDRRLKSFAKEVSSDDKLLKDVSYMQELIEESSFELRSICNGLRPPTLSDLGLLPAIEIMCEEIMLNELLLISLETVGFSREERFNEEVEIAAYRFLQEGITNTVKHSGSNKLRIHIEMNEYRIEMTVRDKGKGFDTSQIDDWLLTGDHFGIVGMKERLESVGGSFEICSTIGRGTMLKATIPIIND